MRVELKVDKMADRWADQMELRMAAMTAVCSVEQLVDLMGDPLVDHWAASMAGLMARLLAVPWAECSAGRWAERSGLRSAAATVERSECMTAVQTAA